MNHKSPITNHQSLAVSLHNVSKKYSLSQERPVLLKNLFVPQKKEEVWALKNVSLSIKKGETIGIIGENGSGKSTFLKIIAGITTPTKGSVQINGRVGSLIELGAGFHQDLTGRENIYLNGTLLGFTKKELDKKYDEIVTFADIGEYIDQPIRTYSSGMTVRLGFSVAVHLDPEILLIDEVLAVGDSEFQQKSVKKMSEFKKNKKTIILVSHNMIYIKDLSDNVIWLDKGRVRNKGEPQETVSYYLNSIKSDNKISWATGTGEIVIDKVLINPIKGEVILSGQGVSIRIYYSVVARISSLNFGIGIWSFDGIYCVGINTKLDQKKLASESGFVELKIDSLPLLPNKYYINIVAFGENESFPYTFIQRSASFEVISKSHNSRGLVWLERSWTQSL